MLVNEQARELGLGSGGFDVLYANLTRGLGLAGRGGRARDDAAVHAAARSRRRTPRRTASSPDRSTGMPVVCCTLHSQVAPVCAALAGLRVAYVQLAGGALPVSLSDTVRDAAGARPRSSVAIAVAPCLDGDVQCVTTAAALAWARPRATTSSSARVGPGHRRHRVAARATARSRSPTRRTSRRALGGRPVLAVRASRTPTPRERHRGVSHHTRGRARALPRRGRRRRPADAGEGWRGGLRRAAALATWAAAPTRTRPSSARPTPPASPRAELLG